MTLSTWRTPLERSLSPEDTLSPVWLNSALTYFQSTSNSDRYAGPPELGYKVGQRGGFARDLREDWDFITVPSLESGKEITVEHRSPVKKLQFWQKREDGYRNEIKPEPGEKWVIGPSEGGLGTFWWRWGDIDGDLKGKEFRNDNWYDEESGDQTAENVNEGRDWDEGRDWVESQGDNGFGRTMKIESRAEVSFDNWGVFD